MAGSSLTPNAACSSAAVAASPTVTSSAMPSCAGPGSNPSNRGSPSGPVTRCASASRWSCPVTRRMISASTQWALVAWYSYDEPGSQLSRQPAKRWSRPSTVSQAGGPSGACGKPEVCSITCSTVMASLPLAPNSGT